MSYTLEYIERLEQQLNDVRSQLEIANKLADEWRDKAKALQIAADAGVDLSLWVASINWKGEKNTDLWLAELREKIERCQQTAESANMVVSGMQVTVSPSIPKRVNWPNSGD